MNRLIPSLLVLILLGATAPFAQKPDAKAVKKAVDDYVGRKATDASKATALSVLADASHADICKELKGSMRKDSERDAALTLAIELQVRGAFELAEKQVAKSPKLATTLGLITDDKGALKTLTKQWCDAEGEVADGMLEAFTTYGMDLDDLAEFKAAALADDQPDDKKASALKVLAFQLGQAVDSAEQVAEKWDGWMTELKDDGQRQGHEGIDCFALSGWGLENVRRMGVNHSIPAGAAAKREEPLPRMEEPEYTLTAWVKPCGADFKGSVGMLIVQQDKVYLLGVEGKEGKWVFTSQQGSVDTPMQADKWQKITWKMTGSSSAKICAIHVDDKKLMENIQFQATMKGLQFHCETGRLVMSSVGYQRD